MPILSLKGRGLEQLRELADDLRQKILSTCLANGGHLGASLGAVELAIALHSVFESPKDALIWDVGHQAYAHKLLTGREKRFSSLRKTGGISGFLSREESEHDVFGAGHSSTSLSAALAVAWAKGRPSSDGRWTVAIIGDGGLTAGLAFEALNNVRAQSLGPLLVVLNDNQMSISPNVGAIPAILSGGKAREFFSLLGFDYAGPIDGHDLGLLIGTLHGIRDAKKADADRKPVVLHVLTQKGKGYAPAEENPGTYHGVSAVTPAGGARRKTFSDSFGEALCHAGEKRPDIVAITAAMPEGTGLTEFARRFPDRFFDVGIAEAHAVTFAAGLATQGFRPVVAVYSTFLQRGLDGVIHDVALQKLPVIFAIDRAGLVGPDGPTHHGAFDLAYLGMIPGLTLLAPESLSDVEACLKEALDSRCPVAIRYPRGPAPERSDPATMGGLRWHCLASQPKLILISVGASGARVAAALQKLEPEKAAAISWVSVVQVKPIPTELTQYLSSHSGARIICVEDGAIHGGFGQQLGIGGKLIGYGDHFVSHGSVGELEMAEGISSSHIEGAIRSILQEATEDKS